MKRSGDEDAIALSETPHCSRPQGRQRVLDQPMIEIPKWIKRRLRATARATGQSNGQAALTEPITCMARLKSHSILTESKRLQP